MTELGRTFYSDQSVIEAYDWPKNGTIVDVGGGLGFLLSGILQKFPNLKGVLFDQKQVIEQAKTNHTDKSYIDRLEYVEGDFFHAVPEGDVYILKRIVHDWEDTAACNILKAVSKSMKQTSKILIIETVIPEGNNPHFGKLLDIHMMVILGGMERTATEYQKLLENSDLKLCKIIPTTSLLNLVEATK
eukprot:TRINITY_DN3256_c0_g1_i1.p1 TRINITY_DN3256_c0_g1~~TRINITY_DN3256_c0_g1_i1.p1  ORF type:complete len:188 (+),score=26.91 TRINITY_DN3256_c0_g1_i1:560-1123(+)